MTKDCDIENNTYTKENHVEVWKKGAWSLKKWVLIQIAHLNQMQSASHNSKKVRINNINDNIIATLNINSLVLKFGELQVIGQGIFYILIINVIRLDVYFPVA